MDQLAQQVAAISRILDHMTEITILTGIDTFVLDNDATTDLLAHVRVCRWTQPTKPPRSPSSPRSTPERPRGQVVRLWEHGALHAINAWLISEGTEAMPDVMLDIRDELMRDLGLPPFDEETPYDAT